MGIFSSISKVLKPVVGSIPVIGPILGEIVGGVGSTVDNNLPSIIGGGAQYFGSQAQNEANIQIARETTAANQAMASEANQVTRDLQANQIAENARLVRESLDFQREHSATAFQRAMADMRAARLNPILAYSQGGASTPSGATGSVASGSGVAGHAQSAQLVNELGPAVSTAMQIKRLDQELKNMRSEQYLRDDQSALAAEQAANVAMDTKKKSYEAEAAAVGVATAKAEERIRRRTAEDTEKYGSSRLGQDAASIERMIMRIYKEVTQ